MATKLMESSPSSRLSFFTTSGKLLQTPIEGLDCGIAVDIPRADEKIASLKRGKEELPLWFSEDSLCALSAWPACGPGQYKVSLDCGDIHERRVITVRPQYFTEEECSQIIDELTNVLPMSVANRLQECGGLGGVNLVSAGALTLEQEYQRLRRAIRGTKERPGILQLLPMIQRDCHQTLIPKHEQRKANKTRRPDMAKLPIAMSMPGNITADGSLLQMFDLTVQRSYETHENRLVKAYVQALQSQLMGLIARAETEKASQAMQNEIQDLFGEFRLTVVRTAFLTQVRLPFNAAGRITMVLLNKPAYRAVLENYLSLFKRVGLRMEDPALNTPLNTPLNKFAYLYQLWVNFKVVKVMLRVCAEAGYRCTDHKWVKRDSDGFYFDLLKDCAVAMELSSSTAVKRIKLIPWSPASGQVASNHRQDMPPALAICVYAAGAPPVVLVFDPKYKVVGEDPEKFIAKQAGAKPAAAKAAMIESLNAIAPMPEHIDELRSCLETVVTAGGQREIQYAAILYPGLKKQIVTGLEALPARPGDGDKLEKQLGDIMRRYLA